MKFSVGKQRPAHYRPAYPEEFDLFSHLELCAAVPQALFAITTWKENGLPNLCPHAWTCFHGDRTAFFAVMGNLYQHTHTYSQPTPRRMFLHQFSFHEALRGDDARHSRKRRRYGRICRRGADARALRGDKRSGHPRELSHHGVPPAGSARPERRGRGGDGDGRSGARVRGRRLRARGEATASARTAFCCSPRGRRTWKAARPPPPPSATLRPGCGIERAALYDTMMSASSTGTAFCRFARLVSICRPILPALKSMVSKFLAVSCATVRNGFFMPMGEQPPCT